MKKILILFILVTSITGCKLSQQAIVPISPDISVDDAYTIIWYGKSEAYIFVDGEYVRNPPYDYVFNVVQKRYDNMWKSTKTLHRNHPDYDFRGGQRSQAMYFEIKYLASDNVLKSVLTTSLGNGVGTSDNEFREQSLILDLSQKNAYYNINNHTPFNKMKITQHYNYEAGILLETVELYKEEKGVITPFAKMEETAMFYVQDKLEKAPTFYNK